MRKKKKVKRETPESSTLRAMADVAGHAFPVSRFPFPGAK
jgi:hypothetical protein